MCQKRRRERREKKERMTDNKIGVEGARAMSEIMKTNTTLTILHMQGLGKRKETEKEKNK